MPISSVNAPLRAALALLAGLAMPAAALAQCTVLRLDMPDFDQRRSVLPNNGSMYCVPTATANALAYISNHGYPTAFGGPRNWASQDHYAYVNAQLTILGIQMGTSATKGTTLNNWFEVTRSRVGDVGYFGVSQYATGGFAGLNPKTLADQMRIGAIVMPVMGWYEDRGGGRWKRNGGHMVTMWGAFNTCGSPMDMLMVYRDPANDSVLTGQGPFTTTPSQFEYLPGSLYATKSETGFFPRIVYRLTASGGFLDGYGAIWPLFGLTTGPLLQDISFSIPEPTTDQPGPRRFDTTLPRGVLVSLGHSATPTEGFALTELAGGRSGELSSINFVDGSVTPIGTMLSPRAMVVGRDGIAYVARSSRIDRYGPLATGGVGLIDSTILPNQADALFYDDATDELVALNQADRRLMRITRAMTIRRNDLIPTAAAVPGDGSVAVNPLDGKEWIAGSGSPTLTRLGRDGTGRLLPEALVGLPGVTTPRALQFGDDGTLYVHDAGAIKAFVPNGSGGWRTDAANPLHGAASGPLFAVSRSRSNYDPAIMEDDNILPPDIGLGEPDCRADLNKDGRLDIFDFLEFQNLFDAGSTWADFDYDGALTIFDFLAYQNAFDAGC